MTLRRLFDSDRNPIAPVAKSYALTEHTGGVPAEEQSLLLGATPTRRTLGQITGSFAALQIATARDIKTLTDTIRVSWTDSGSTLHELRCVAGAVRDLDATDTGSETTLTHYVLATSVDGTEACRVGRNQSDRVLVENAGGDYAALPSTIAVTVEDERWREGMLGQRVQDLRAVEHEHTIALHRAAASLAGAGQVPDTVGYDGADVTGDLGAWSRYADPITIPDGEHEVIATGVAAYNFDQSRWRTPGDWVYQLGDDGFSTMYAASEDGAWHAPPALATDEWVRHRQGDGTWAAHRLRGADAPYVLCLDHEFTAADDGQTNLALAAAGGRSYDLSAYQKLLLVWEWTATSSPKYQWHDWVEVPTPLIRAVAASASNVAWQRRVTIRPTLRGAFASYVRLSDASVTSSGDDEFTCWMRLELRSATDGTLRLDTFDQVRIWHRRNVNLRGRLTGYLLR